MYKREPVNAVVYAIYEVHKRLIWICFSCVAMAEMMAIYCCYNTGYLIEFMQTKDKPSQYEISLLFMFSFAFVTQIFLRNLHYFYNNMLALKLKKLFMTVLYHKLSKISLDSMGEISDGKLITLLQSFIFILEKILMLVYFCAVAPVALIVSCILIAMKGGLLYAIVVQVLYIMLFWL